MAYTDETKGSVLQELVGVRDQLTREINWYYDNEASETNASGLAGRVDEVIRGLEGFKRTLRS